MNSHVAVAGAGASTPLSSRPAAPPLELEPEFLALVGWDWEKRVVAFPATHPLLGWNGCRIRGCVKATSTRTRLCPTCTNGWQRSGMTFEDYLAVAARTPRRRGRELCAVIACERPAVGSLCAAHKSRAHRLGLPPADFVNDPRAAPLKRLGPCQVLACPRDRPGTGRFCVGHTQQYRLAVVRADFDEAKWLRVTAPIAESNEVVLSTIDDQVVRELLLGLQTRVEAGISTHASPFRQLAQHSREREVKSLRDLPSEVLQRWVRNVRDSFVATLDRREHQPLSNWSASWWALDSVGAPGRSVKFGAISQQWLRDALKHWVLDDLPNRRGDQATGVIQNHVDTFAQFSASLRRHRDDGGADPRALSRNDIVELLNWMGYLVSTNEMSALTRQRRCRELKKVFLRMRTMGLARPGQPLEGLPDDVTLVKNDIPPVAEETPGRDLPASLVATLLEHLPVMEATSVECRVAVDLLIDTGRRPGEIINLALDCLTRDADGRPVLLWNNFKSSRYGLRLPISESTAAIIVKQQDRVRSRFPHLTDDQRVLLPGRSRSNGGTRALSKEWLSDCHRAWVKGLPELTAPVDVMEGGRTVSRELPFDKNKITLYCWRHTYAQRHADAGVAVDVLCELMDHKHMSTTQGYYRVSESRRRDAVDRVSGMQFDRRGDRVWRRAESLMDSERARRSIGEVAVPYGLCTEPSNVAAGGGDCPVRFRCVGCDHFRTDVSYLPDLEGYLADLLRHRERLRATTTADAWAIAEAMPSDEEVDRVRTLIRRVKADLDDLDPAAHAEVRAAVEAVRRTRRGAVGLGMPRVGPESIAIREGATRP